MSSILLAGTILFIISSLYFLINPKKGLNSAFFVSFVTLISYLIMLEGRFVTDNSHWTRWAFYGISCGLLSYEISKRVGLDLTKQVSNIILTVIVMFTGALASVSTTQFKWYFFAVSCFAFAKLLLDIFNTKSKELAQLSPYMIFGWCAFPIVFLLSNEGVDVLNFEIAAGIYLLLDFLTKIVFYIHSSRSEVKS